MIAFLAALNIFAFFVLGVCFQLLLVLKSLPFAVLLIFY
jgi:hypothetical protein